MLLKQMIYWLTLILWFILSPSSAQNFKSGLARLTSSPATASNYTINFDHKTNDLIISICSFSAQPVTSCHISAKTDKQANFTCTANIQTIAFLFYEKTPMVYSNSFTFYFFAGTQADRKGYAIWKVQKGLTVAYKPQLRAVLSGFKAKDDAINKIELRGLEDGWSVNITRTTNIQIVNFSYILIQNYSPYNLTFVDYKPSFSSGLQLRGQRKNYLNFWGIQSLKSSRSSLEIPFGVTVDFNGAVATDSNILSIVSFSMPNNTSIEGLFLLDNTNINTLNCGMRFYQPSAQKCIDQCPGYNLNWNTSIFSYRYCLMNSNDNYANYLNETYIDSNLWELKQKHLTGCAQTYINQDVQLQCLKCQLGYIMYRHQCICQYGYYLIQGICRPCNNRTCHLPIISSANLINLQTNNRTINIRINLPIEPKYKFTLQNPFFLMNVTVNKLIYSAQVNYENQSKCLNFIVNDLQPNNHYQVHISANVSDSNQLVVVAEEEAKFLWIPSASINIDVPLGPKAVIKSIAPLLAETDKSLPVIMVLIFFLGDKINTISLFQTVSLLYLINFIPIGQQYSSLQAAISQIFIFQPKPLITLAGSHPDAWIYIPQANITQIPYNKLVYLYTEGQMFLSRAFNCIASLIIQIGTIVIILKTAKNCFKPSKNRVQPYIHARKNGNLDLSRSRIMKSGIIQWVRDIQVRGSASLRYKCYVYLCKLDSKKWIGISSLWSMNILSLSLLLFHQLSLPTLSFYSFLSTLCCYVTLLGILFFPIYLREYEPLHLLKCVSTCYKRRQYKQGQLWLYYYINYIQPLVYACITVCSDDPIFILGSILTVMAAKVYVLRSTIKNIEVLRAISIFLFFLTALVSCRMDSEQASTMINMMGYSLVLVVAVQMLKLFRATIVLVLGLFKTSHAQPKPPAIIQSQTVNQMNPVLKYLQTKHNGKNIQALTETTHPTIILREPQINLQANIQDSSKEINNHIQPQYRSRAFRRRLPNPK